MSGNGGTGLKRACCEGANAAVRERCRSAWRFFMMV